VRVVDEFYISQKAYRAIAGLYSDLEQDYQISKMHFDITNFMAMQVPINTFLVKTSESEDALDQNTMDQNWNCL